MFLRSLRRIGLGLLALVILVHSSWGTPPTVANTLPNIIARLTASGEKVQIVSQASDSTMVNWVILSRENAEGGVTYSLVKTLEGAADGIRDGVNVPMQIVGLVNSEVIEPLVSNFIRYLLEAHENDLVATQEYVTEHGANFSGASDQIRLIFSQYGLQLP